MAQRDVTPVDRYSRSPHRLAATVVLLVVAANLVLAAIVQWWSTDRLGLIVEMATAVVLTAAWGRSLDYVLLLGGLLTLEMLVLGWQRSSICRLLRFSRSARTDLAIAALHGVGWATLLMITFTGGVLWLVQDLLVPFESLDLIGSIRPLWLQVLVVFVVTDFIDYWYHRISHEIEFLWEAHKYHHAATEFTILTGNRVHALEDALRHVVLLVPLALMGTPAVTYVAVRYGVAAVDVLQHSMLPWTYGWIGRWFVYSPIGHRIHHSALEEHWDRNFGNILVVWDRLFGTWYSGSRINDHVDVTHNPYHRRSVVFEYLLCAGWSLRALQRSTVTGLWRTESGRVRRSAARAPRAIKTAMDRAT